MSDTAWEDKAWELKRANAHEGDLMMAAAAAAVAVVVVVMIINLLRIRYCPEHFTFRK